MLLAALLLAALLPAALAYTPGGFGVPEPLGAFSGPTGEGAMGVAWTPAAALPPSGQWALDLGWVYSATTFTLDADPENPIVSEGASVAPSFGGAEPLGPLGLGFAFFPLIARGGGEAAGEDELRRFYSYQGGIQLLEANISVAWSPWERWTFGAGPRIGFASFSSRKAIDSGALIGKMTGDWEDAPVGDPLLEGEQDLDGHSGTALGVSLGARFVTDIGFQIDVAYHSGLTATMTGPLVLTPSNDLDMELHADVETPFPFPPAAFLGLRMPLGGPSVVCELHWIGWGSMNNYQSYPQNFTIASDDATMQSILESYGLTEAEFLEDSSGSTVTTGMTSTLNMGLAIDAPIGERWQVLAGVWRFNAAVPDLYVHPSNLDFGATDLRAGGTWAAKPWLTVAASGDLYLGDDRDVEESLHSFIKPGEGGALVPSGIGQYTLSLSRLGLTFIFRHGLSRGG